MTIEQLAWIRTIPGIGGRLYDAMKSIQNGMSAFEHQGNFNPTGQPAAPPNIQALNVTANDGHFNFAIQDQSAGLRRGVSYFIEHADNPAFNNSHAIKLGDSRNHNEYLGNVTRYFRAYSGYDSSPASQHVYFGSASSPTPVQGGGSNAGPSFLPSEGIGTGAANQGGMGAGPIPERIETSGFDWKLGRAQGSQGGFPGIGTPAAFGASDTGSGGGGGGGGVTVSEPVIASSEWLKSVTGTNTIAAVTSIPYSALAAGFVVRMIPVNTNSGATTLNVNSTGAKAVTKNGTTALVGGELFAGKEYFLMYDGTRWQIIGIIAPISATVLASDANGVPSVAPLADTKVWVGSGSNLPVAQTVSGDATLADTGALTLATVNASVGTFGDASNVSQVTLDAKGRVTAAANVPITYPGTTGFTGTVALAKLTGGGTNGSLSVGNGLILIYVAPT